MTNIHEITADQFEDKILRAKGLVLLDFFQATCAPCRALEPRLEQVARQHANVPVYIIDLERDFSLANRLDVKSIPTVLVFRDGNEIQRLDGLITTEQLQSALE